MKKLIKSGEVITVENPKDFFGNTLEDQFVIVTHDLTFMLQKPRNKYYSAWLSKEELDKALINARPYTFFDKVKLFLKRKILNFTLNKREKIDYEFSI